MQHPAHLSSRAGCGGAPTWLSIVCLILAVSVVVVACSTERNYKTLSIFFDGVPDPNAPKNTGLQDVDGFTPEEYLRMTSEERGALLARRVPKVEIYFHEPAKQKRCDACHEFQKPAPGAGFSIGIPKLIVPKEELCQLCHEPPQAAYVHGPAANGSCSFCHLPHQSLYPHLLRVERPSELCLSCHTPELFVTAADHEIYGDESCTTCHDPHASQYPALLREEGDPGAFFSALDEAGR